MTETAADKQAHIRADIRERVIDALKTVYDPEIPVDIYELGHVVALCKQSHR